MHCQGKYVPHYTPQYGKKVFFSVYHPLHSHAICSIDTIRLIWYDSYRTINTDEKILKTLAALQEGQQALRADVKTLNGKVDTVEQGQQALQDVQEQQWKQYAQQGKILAGIGATVGTILD